MDRVEHPHVIEYGYTIYLCTADRPWPGGRPPNGARVRHDNTQEVGEQEDGWPGGDIVTIECRNCGTRWQSELPQ